MVGCVLAQKPRVITSDNTLIHLAPGAQFTATNGCYVMSESLYLRYRQAVSDKILELHGSH